jgi:recombination protein RecT
MTQAEQTTEVVAVVAQELTISQAFAANVERQFKAEAGSPLAWTPLQKTLAQHLFLKIDAQLKELEKKRTNNSAPIIWDNINKTKLYTDAVNRISLGLDATLPNHISPIPYWNSALAKYDLDLRIGYEGKFYSKMKLAVEIPEDVVIELVYSNDKFKLVKRDWNNRVEHYILDAGEAFDRGEVVGGFGYIMYENPIKNKVVIVTQSDFDKAKALAQTKDFWNAHPEIMKRKTVVHRVMAHIPLDPEKVNIWAEIEGNSIDVLEAEFSEEVAANSGSEVLTMDAEPEAVESQSDDERIGKAPADDASGDPGF